MTPHLSAIRSALQRILSEGGNENFVVFSLAHDATRYVQYMASKGGTEVYAEAVSNYFLPHESQLDAPLLDELERLGWDAPTKEGNYSYTWLLATPETVLDVADHAVLTLGDVYGLSDSDELDVNISFG